MFQHAPKQLIEEALPSLARVSARPRAADAIAASSAMNIVEAGNVQQRRLHEIRLAAALLAARSGLSRLL